MIYNASKINVHLLAKYRLCVISLDTEVPDGRWENSIQCKYTLSASFLPNIFSCLVFVFSLNQQAPSSLHSPYTPTPAI